MSASQLHVYFDPAVLHQGIYPTNMPPHVYNLVGGTPTAAVFVMARSSKQVKRQPLGDWSNKLMEYHTLGCMTDKKVFKKKDGLCVLMYLKNL